MISGDVPMHLVIQARTGFLTTAEPAIPTYAPIANVFTLTARQMELVDLGSAPMPTQNRGRPQFQDFVEKALAVTAKDWDISVWISYNAVKDDQTGELDRKVRGAGSNFQRHISQQCFSALNAGDASTLFGLGYDGLTMFNANHVDKGAAYTTVQNNVNALTLNLTNFTTVRTAMRKILDDQGQPADLNYDLLVVSPDLEAAAFNITSNREDATTANRAANPWAGITKYIVSPKLDATAWFLVASSEPVKPIIIAMREPPSLQSAWFDPNAPDGGRYYFKFYARYNHFYGDWRLAAMGNT
jgi:phage major head subunit gpT-like protein